MKNTFLKILISLAVLWLLLIGISRLYDFALTHNCNLKAAYVQRATINADILIHGPCEPLWFISPAILDKQTGLKSYNLALSHSDFADNYLHLYFYLKNNVPPKLLFLFVTPESMDENYNTFNTYRFTEFIGDAEVDKVVKENDSAYFYWIGIPFMKYGYYSSKVNFDALQGLKHYFTNRTLPHFPDGYEPPIQVKWDNHLEKFIQLYPKGYRFKWSPKREKCLDKIIELAQQKGTKVYLFESPVLKESLQYLPNREEIVERIKGVAKQYGIVYKQFDNLKIADSRENFMSALNLNLNGSRIFAEELGKYIKNECLDK